MIGKLSSGGHEKQEKKKLAMGKGLGAMGKFRL